MKKKSIIGIVVAAIIVTIIVAIVVTIFVTGKSKEDTTTESSSSEVSKNTKGNHDVFECIKLINPKNSVEEINEIIGFEGKCTNEENKVYVWELTEDTNVEVQYSKSNEGKIEISFPSKLIANDKVDFSRFSEIKKALNTKESLTYDQFVELVGGVEGTLKSKNSSSLKYEWDNTEGGYLFATFSVRTGKCTFTTGRF